MISEKIHKIIQGRIKQLQEFTDRFWYPPLVGFLAALDNLVIIIPTDGILISSSMLTPKRWFLLAFCTAAGSTLGALALASLVEFYGLPWILQIYPGLDETQTWIWTHDFFERYGLLLVFAVGLSPLMQHPAIILASLAETPLLQLAVVVFGGRFIKFLIMAYVGSHTPRLLSRLWGVKNELKEVGVNIK